MTRSHLFSTLAIGLALAIALPATSQAEDLSPSDIISALKPKPAVRSIKVDPKVQKAKMELEEILAKRKISVTEREKIVEIKKEVALPSLDFSITFDYDSAEISPDSFPTLDKLAAAIKSEELYALRFLVNGHTDSKGTDAYNLALSDRRANAVVAYLVEKHAVDETRLKAIGFGETQLKDESDGESAVNRRVEIVSVPAS